MTALYVVLVPLLGVFFGRRPGVKLGICACISLAGLYLLCLAGHDTLTLTGGEWMLLLCSLLFAFQIMLVASLQPQAGRCAAELCGIFCNGGSFHYFYVCV